MCSQLATNPDTSELVLFVILAFLGTEKVMTVESKSWQVTQVLNYYGPRTDSSD